MHIEPGLVAPTKMVIGYVTAAGFLALSMRSFLIDIVKGAIIRVAVGMVVTIVVTLLSFEILPHPLVGVSEVHLIVGATLYLLFGFAPVAIGMAGGLLIQGLFFAPADIAQYGMNVTTLLASLYAIDFVATRGAYSRTRYVDMSYGRVAKLSLCFQGSIVAWVAFWVLLGQGATFATLQSITSFGATYVLLITVEVALGIGMLSLVRSIHSGRVQHILNPRLFAVPTA